jgi:outer membrane protein
MKKLLLVLFCLCSLQAAHAQIKIAYTNADSILRALPETKAQEEALRSYGQILQTQLQRQQKALEDKMAELEKEKDNLPQIVLQERVKELRQMEENLMSFQQDAQRDMQAKEQELVGPILERVEKGINEVAKELGYAFVLPENVLLYADPANDITQLVIKKLTAK